MKKQKISQWAFWSALFILSCLLFFLHWKQLHVPNDHYRTPYFSDIFPHFRSALNSNKNGYTLLFPLIRAFYYGTGENVDGAAFLFSLFLVLCFIASVLLVRKWYCMVYEKKPGWLVNGLSLSSVMVSMLVSPRLFTGQSRAWYVHTGVSPNVWHNSTTALCRPLSIIVVMLIYKIVQAHKNGKPIGKYLWLNVLFATLSMWAKPSFLMAFLPALCIFLLFELWDNKEKIKEQFVFSIKVGLSFVPAMGIILWQYLYLFMQEKPMAQENPVVSQEASGVSFALALSLQQIVKLFIFPAGFVTVAMLLCLIFKMQKKKTWIFTSAWFFVAMFIKCFLLESGKRATDGNFDWPLSIALFFLFMIYSGELFLKEHKGLNKWKLFCIRFAAVVYSAHLITGILWFAKILTGRQYG